MQPLTLAKLFAEATLAVIALITIIASSPLLVSKARLIAERNQARTEADSLRDAVSAFQLGLGALDHLRAEVLEIRTVQIISTRYVVDLISSSARAGPPTRCPPSRRSCATTCSRRCVTAPATRKASRTRLPLVPDLGVHHRDVERAQARRVVVARQRGIERRTAQIVGEPARYSHTDGISCTVTTPVTGTKC